MTSPQNPGAGVEERGDVEPGCDLTDLPARGEIRIIDGKRCRFIERELEGDKWEVLEPVAPPPPPPPPQLRGCICPPGSEMTCQGPLCPRRPLYSW